MTIREVFVGSAVLLGACAGGFGPSTAATRPLLGQTMSNDDATMWVPTSDQANVPAGMVRVEQVSDGFARVFNWVSITSAVRKGSMTPTIRGVAGEAQDALELDLALTARIPLPVGGVSIGVGNLLAYDDQADLAGLGVRASIAPIGQLSVDLAHSWLSGTMTVADVASDIAGTRTSLGGTVLLWGLNQFRFGVAVAKVWTRAGDYESEGYTYQLVSTMY